MRISPAQHDLFIQAKIGSHIASLVDPKNVRHKSTVSKETRERRRKAQADREYRAANREAYE